MWKCVITVCLFLNLYIELLTEKYSYFIILKIAEECGRNVNVNLIIVLKQSYILFLGLM